MMRRIAGLLSLAALAASAAPAAAAPPGHGLVIDPNFTCEGMGQTTITHSAGHNAYIGDQHYAVASFMFTSTDGTTETFTFGHKAGLSDSVTCTQEQEDGTFTVVLLPVPPGG